MLIDPPALFRKRRGRVKSKTPVVPPAPVNAIASVRVLEDLRTTDIFFTPGTVVTGMNLPSDNFFVNYSGGQTNGPGATVVGPMLVRIVLNDAIDSPATWEVDSSDAFTFASGEFAGPNSGDVVFE